MEVDTKTQELINLNLRKVLSSNKESLPEDGFVGYEFGVVDLMVEEDLIEMELGSDVYYLTTHGYEVCENGGYLISDAKQPEKSKINYLDKEAALEEKDQWNLVWGVIVVGIAMSLAYYWLM